MRISLVPINMAYTQNFDTRASIGTSSALPVERVVLESVTNANFAYNTGTGNSNGGDTSSLGATGSTQRASGGLQPGRLVPTFGTSFTNDTGRTLNEQLIGYLLGYSISLIRGPILAIDAHH